MQRVLIGTSRERSRLAACLLFTVALVTRSQIVFASSSERQVPENHPKIAIIGAGIGGAFVAFDLRRLLNDTAELHM